MAAEANEYDEQARRTKAQAKKTIRRAISTKIFEF